MFVDRTTITVHAGNGGNGCASFRREKFVPKGGPDGGDGAPGGDVILRAVRGEQSLVRHRYNPEHRAASGQHGMGKKRHGRAAEHTVLDVPRGTLVKDAETGELLADLIKTGEELVAARGGKGGRGNCHFVTSTRRAPRECEEGGEGESRHLELVLKTVADIGLVGYPNAGKSSLLEALTHAHPKTASYPFTTRTPVVGMLDFPDFTRITIADIPGLIDGAHRNVGLGHTFLRHIERANGLLFVLDMEGTDERDPIEDLRNLREELRLYQAELIDRPALVVANKMDGEHAAANLARLRNEENRCDIFPVCAVLGEGVDELKRALHRPRNSLGDCLHTQEKPV